MFLTNPYHFDPTYGYDLDALLKIAPPQGPSDLEDFWADTYSVATRLLSQISCRQIGSERPNKVNVFEIEFNSLGGFRIGGWLTLPVHDPPVRGVVVGHGYGGRDGPDYDIPGPPAAVIFPCMRGQGRSRTPEIPEYAHKHVLTGIESRETYVLRGCVADIWCAASALTELFPIAHDCLHYMGTSFGGGLGALALAWDRRFSAAYLGLPTFGNHPLRVTLPCLGSGEALRKRFRRHPDVMDVLRYYDAAATARFITMPMVCTCALFDPAVPPPGQFAVYNALAGPKTLFVSQAGHFAYPEEEKDQQKLFELLDRHATRTVPRTGQKRAPQSS